MHESRPLTFESMLRDPIVRAVMRSDRVSVHDMLRVLGAAQAAIARRERQAVRRILAHAAATSVRDESPASRAPSGSPAGFQTPPAGA